MANITNEFKFIELPTLLCLGADMLKSIPEIIDRLTLGSKALLITDDFLRLRIGKEVEDILSDSENHSVYTSISQDSTLDEVDNQLSIQKETQPDWSVIYILSIHRPQEHIIIITPSFFPQITKRPVNTHLTKSTKE